MAFSSVFPLNHFPVAVLMTFALELIVDKIGSSSDFYLKCVFIWFAVAISEKCDHHYHRSNFKLQGFHKVLGPPRVLGPRKILGPHRILVKVSQRFCFFSMPRNYIIIQLKNSTFGKLINIWSKNCVDFSKLWFF